MSIQKTTTELETLKINYLTQAMYEDALANSQINSDELYLTPNTSQETVYVTVTTSASMPGNGMTSAAPSFMTIDSDDCTFDMSFDDMWTAYEAGKKLVALVEAEDTVIECPLVKGIDDTDNDEQYLNFECTYHQLNNEGPYINYILVSTLKDSSGSTPTYTNSVEMASASLAPMCLNYVTTAPTAANTRGLKIALLDSEPATKYAGWIYLIQES